MKRWAVAALVLVCSCSSFIREERRQEGYEEGRYVMKQNAGREDAPLRKGEASI